MKSYKILFILISLLLLAASVNISAQDEEPILYFQMEPLDDSLFIHIQQALFIDPPDPKAEIIADLRDPNNSTISIKGTLYPFLALEPELRARVQTYPFKINLEEQINYGSVFTRVIEKIKLNKLTDPPSKIQISPHLAYINPFLQIFGGERLGIPIKKDIGLSFGIGTKYSGPLETNFVEANFHILGFYGGIYSNVDAMIDVFNDENHNNLIVANGFQIGYVIPFGNFFEIGYLTTNDKITDTKRQNYIKPEQGTIAYNEDGSIRSQAWLLDNDSFVNWEFRYPISILGSTRGKVYVGQYLDEWHIGLIGREMSLAGSTFDFTFDAMTSSPYRNPQYVVNVMVQKVMELWAFSAVALGPSAIFSETASGSFGATRILVNLRIKIGTSL